MAPTKLQARIMFISLDGIDGVGKSTQIAQLKAHLESRGNEVVSVCDPGSTNVGARLRSLLLDGDLQIHRRTEAMLFMASRCEMVETIIRPALSAGKWVISDRFLLANVVYQSVGGEVTPGLLWELGRAANGGIRPDWTILLDMPARESIQRLQRPADRMEARGEEYLESVRRAFLEQLPESSPRTAVIRADQPADAVTRQLLSLEFAK
ncbi:MAG: dTMP kinase [Planctomycetota bacterium]